MPAAYKNEDPKITDVILNYYKNELTNSQKWAWVIGLTLAAYGLIYWSQKQPNK